MIALYLVFAPFLFVACMLSVLWLGFGERGPVWAVPAAFGVGLILALGWLAAFMLAMIGVITLDWPLAWEG